MPASTAPHPAESTPRSPPEIASPTASTSRVAVYAAIALFLLAFWGGVACVAWSLIA